jgi:hypothetical protein
MAHDLANRVDSNKFTVFDPVSAALLDRIRAGIAVSRFCPKKYQTYFASNQQNS